MADPLSVTASVIGILGVALHGSRRLFELIDSLQSAPKDIASLSTDLKALHGTLERLTHLQQKLDDNRSLCDPLKAALENCLDIFQEFTLTLQSYTQASSDGTRKVRTWKKIVWAFKDKEIQLFRDTILTYKASLNLAANAVTLFTTTSIDERTKRMESDFKEEFKQIQSQLKALEIDRIELASIVEEQGSEGHVTDAHFALNRFLEYTESLWDSPPASFPGSPVIPPSDVEWAITSKDTASTRLDELQYDVQHQQPMFPILNSSFFSNPANPELSSSQEPRNETSNFDIFKALWLVSTRKDPKIDMSALNFSGVFVVCDAVLDDWPIIYASEGFQNLTGYSRHEIIGKNCRFLQAPDGKVQAGSKRVYVDDTAVYSLKKMIQSGHEIQQSMINYRKGGKPFLNLMTIIPIPWDTPETRYFVGCQIDLVESPDAIPPLIQ
ncbi:PAS domain-containing protein [Dactylonectria macrodidyma]|uniref:PAS domain-containing protein n=1 Tax=Dactylonectria macrodidyma TaxID=307937 RepID=A0A9P9DYR3_9HYPO|nr:PAS domain-containing protein [Dactylonectria macrodidyma]